MFPASFIFTAIFIIGVALRLYIGHCSVGVPIASLEASCHSKAPSQFTVHQNRSEHGVGNFGESSDASEEGATGDWAPSAGGAPRL